MVAAAPEKTSKKFMGRGCVGRLLNESSNTSVHITWVREKSATQQCNGMIRAAPAPQEPKSSLGVFGTCFLLSKFVKYWTCH